MFEAGDWHAWWRLNQVLTLTPTITSYSFDPLDYSIAEMHGWKELMPQSNSASVLPRLNISLGRDIHFDVDRC